MNSKNSFVVTILGSGTSSGVPLIQCPCSVCQSRSLKNKRLRASAWIQKNNKSFLIDTSPDLRQQALRHKIPRIDAVLYTHPHADHLHGIDDLRNYNFIQKDAIPIFGNEWTENELKKKFNYTLSPKTTPGGGIPKLQFNLINTHQNYFEVMDEKIIPISLEHGHFECVGYRIDSFAYIVDCHYISESSLQKLHHLDVLILDCVRLTPHPTHLHLDLALEVALKLKPKKTFLTHLGHEIDYKYWSKKLPKNVFLAYDGLKITIE